jgi:chromosome segregation ATPase
LEEKQRELKDLKRQIADARAEVHVLKSLIIEVQSLDGTRAALHEQVRELQDCERSFADRAKRLERLKDDESEVRASIDRLQQWLQKLQQDKDGYEAMLPVEEQKLAICRQDLADTCLEIETAHAKLNGLQAGVEALQQQKADATAEFETARADLTELTNRCADQQERSSNLAQDISAMEGRLSTLETEIASAELERDSLRDQGDRLSVALQGIRTEQTAELAKLDELSAQTTARTKECAAATALAAEATATLEALRTQEAEQRSVLAELDAEASAERATLADLREEQSIVSGERDQAREEVLTLNSQLTELAEMRQLGTKDLEALDATLASRRTSLLDTEEQIRQTEQLRDERQLEAEEAKANLIEVEEELLAMQSDRDRCGAELESLRTQREQLLTEIEEATSDKERLTMQCSARDEELAAKHASLESIMGNLVGLQSLVSTREGELSELESRIKTRQAGDEARLRQHREELDTVLGKVAEATSALEAVTERVAHQEAEIAHLDTTAADLRDQVASRIRERDRLEAGITQKREFLGSLEQQFPELETSFQRRMGELQVVRDRTEEELAAKITSLDAATNRLTELDAAKRDLGDVTADYNRTLALRTRAAERLRQTEDREQQLHERIIDLERRASDLRKSSF